MSATWWIKIARALDDHPKVINAGWLGKELYLYLLRLNGELAAEGAIPASFANPEYLKLRWRFPGETKEIIGALDSLIAARLIDVDEAGNLTILGWNREEWGGPLSGAERQKRHRKVTASNASNATRPDQTRSDQTRPDQKVSPADIRDIGDDLVTRTVDYFNRACRGAGVERRARVHDAHAKRIRRLVKRGAKELELRLVVLWAIEGPERWPANEVLREHLKLETLFKAQSPNGSRTFWDYRDAAIEWADRRGVALEGLDKRSNGVSPETEG